MSVQSTMMPLGTPMPEFSLPDVVTGNMISPKDFADKKAMLVMFICRHCPYVQHVKEELTRLGKDYNDKDIGIIAISSNDPAAYPEDSPVSLKKFVLEEGFNFPLVFDESQSVAKSFTAMCTPDIFLFDKGRKLVYRGQLDSSRPGNNDPVNGKDLRLAIEAVLSDTPVNPDQRPSSGCSIKWKAGNVPAYLTG